MRKLVVIAAEQYVRNLVAAGAFDEIDDDTFYVSGGLRDLGPLEDHPRYLGAIEGAAERRATYLKLRRLLLASYRFRSRTQRIKLRFVPPVQRLILRLQSLPGPRQVLSRRYLRQTGLNPQLHALMEEVRPDLVIAPSGGTDNLVIDALRSAQALGIRSLLLVYNWDNLSSKGTFPVKPDHLGVVGPQSVEHAWRIHRIPGERVTVLGAPYIDSYFFHEPGSTASPFPFRYALFAGCYMPFDELTPLRALEAAIEERGLDVKVVYRPHPQRRRRKVDDFFDEREFRHVVLDPQVRDGYRQAAREQTEGEDAPAPLPALDYYPALLEHAQFVICPLSTMVLESAIFERRVIAVAYHDGVHKDSPGVVIGYDHFQGMDAIDGLEMCRRAGDLVPLFLRLVDDPAPRRSLRDQVHPWIYHDERPYRRRLAELVARLGDATAGARATGGRAGR